MLSFILRRALIAIPTIILISLFVFGMQKMLPGDPVLAMAGEDRDPATMEFLREKYHLNDPVPVQYLNWVRGVLTGDLGISLRTNQPVLELIGQKLPVTIQLATMAMAFALIIGIPTGILSVNERSKLTRFQRLILTRRSEGKAPRRAALI
ncbi:ABC transporter permease [Antarcticimicrobium sediminis]|uniref:ABC transporter permease n=1 Tax=Antarcticimicrobium sediminis TaxID=2546227 RepID=UPI0024787A5E|nr:ABC transporter permease [Antarcticimicrobium sediminis]